MNVYLNCETRPPLGTSPHPSMVRAPSHYKDQVKIDAYKAERMVAAWEHMAVEVFSAQVFVISFAAEDDDVTVMMTNDEKGLLEAFEKQVQGLLERAHPGPITWVTFNGWKFDHPMMFSRALKHGCNLAAAQMRCPKWGDAFHVDVFNILGGNLDRDDAGSLDDWCAFYGVELDNPIGGHQISQSALKQQHDLIHRHTISRIEGARGLWKVLQRGGVVR